MLSPHSTTRPNIVYNPRFRHTNTTHTHTHAYPPIRNLLGRPVSVAHLDAVLMPATTENERAFYIRTQTILFCGQQFTSGNLVTSISTQNGHKGSSSQGDGTIASPARRSEVSPIQYHVSIRRKKNGWTIYWYLFIYSLCICWHPYYICVCLFVWLCCVSAIRMECEMWIRYFLFYISRHIR